MDAAALKPTINRRHKANVYASR